MSRAISDILSLPLILYNIRTLVFEQRMKLDTIIYTYSSSAMVTLQAVAQ